MARIRTIKPEFWTSEQVVECSIETRLLFVGVWNFCDDGGVMKNSPRQIKMQVFPADDYSSDDVRRMLDELVSNDLIHIYEVGNTSYIRVSGWHHQKIDRPNYKFPQPNGDVPTNKEHYLRCLEYRVRRTLDEQSPPEGSLREGKGKESKGEKTSEKKFSDDDLRLAEYMFEKIKVVLPKTKEPNLDNWADTIRLMRERDKLTHREIAGVFAWANDDDFWKTNILSPTKLREQFAVLHAKATKPKNPTAGNQSNQIDISKFGGFGEPSEGDE